MALLLMIITFCMMHGISLAFQHCPPSLASKSTTSSTSSSLLFAGPKSEGRRRPARDSSAGPRPPPRQRRQQRQQKVAFDGAALTVAQEPNDAAPAFDVFDEESTKLRCMTCSLNALESATSTTTKDPQQPLFEYKSLDEVHEGLSELFNANADFRAALRDAIRRDVFDTTPAYANVSEKAASILLLPDSSLQGSWQSRNSGDDRMKRLTQVLKDHGIDLVGDDFMHRLGALCGPKPSTHWMDIVGVQNRQITHSWHLDTGISPTASSKTLLWGFPPPNNGNGNDASYTGCGVFSHIVPLAKPCQRPRGDDGVVATTMEPILFDGIIPDEHIVRPEYAPGRELLLYRDVDVLHSSPDVTYRTSIMRFM